MASLFINAISRACLVRFDENAHGSSPIEWAFLRRNNQNRRLGRLAVCLFLRRTIITFYIWPLINDFAIAVSSMILYC